VRLHTIKLSGFKSFAEPTTFSLPGQLVGVVGPNGCGKSNIMDAVRWVLGESKASELRGESMQDVIFNGTTQRKPASRASVELVFDNASHRASGPWGSFAEIAVKRVLTRDGTSSYFINNQPVRRRDVQDVFLGTGLGPRAYAIIGQGTISRIIESRPEELRLFLEEAAGVSKYKERRRETANRLHDSRENLTRVQDILRELNANLDKLDKQAEVAQRYHALQHLLGVRQQQLWLLKRRDAEGELSRVQAVGAQAVNALEGRMADLRRVEADLETIRQAHYEAGDELNQAQGRLYEAGAAVARLEAEIRYVVEGRQRVQQRLGQLQEQSAQWAQRLSTSDAELQALAEQHECAAEQAERLAAQLEEQAGQLPDLEATWQQAQGRAAAQRTAVLQVQQAIQVLAAEQRGFGEQSRQLQARRERLAAERRVLQAPDEARLQALEQQLQAAQSAGQTLDARLQALQAEVPQCEAVRKQAQLSLNQQAQAGAELAARLAALKALQEQLQTDGQLLPWLSRHGLDALPPLWQRLHVEPGWESAIEAALQERLAALEVARLEMVGALAADAPPARLAFFSLAPLPLAGSGSVPPPLSLSPPLQPLTQRLRLHDAALHSLLGHWLHGCWTADSLEQALGLRTQWPVGTRVFTPQGHVVTATHVSFYAPDGEQSGLLARAHEIDNLGKQWRTQSLMADQARASLNRAEAAYADASERLQSVRQEAAQQQSQVHALQVECLRLAQHAEQARQRSHQLAADLAEVEQQLEALQERRIEAEGRFEELDLQLADGQERHAQTEDAVIAAQRRLTQVREQLRTLERRAQEAAFAQRSLDARRGELHRARATAEQQLQALADEQQRAQAEWERLSDAAAEGGLQAALEARLERERALAAQRSQYDAWTARLRASDERRLQLERELEPLRGRITDARLKEQAAQMGLQQYQQWLAEAGADLAALEQGIEAEGVKLHGLQGEIERCQRDITALGAVNLAALEELSSARERKQFLDAQSSDLDQAIQTLEDAIRKIDAETRDLLGSTFATVNGHFGKMFPDLFGGGQARLVMSGAEILDAGVQVMAQPPGKKNQTIHLLSGGEKALTAIALVFAIFQLNPAPFCLLDEVDAPLDDANTERYAKLVLRMSTETQFLFISHNKIAMQMAQQLIGVTMQEQGVSRIVAVDMETASNMMEA
jgi:chromosome segregation protein